MHPATLAAISSIAGVNLVPSMDYEVGHINLMVKDDTTVQQELVHAKAGKHGTGSGSAAGDKPIVGWHTDSYPFVVVLMLSDCTNMVGGETAIRTPSGEIRKVRGPGQVCLPSAALANVFCNQRTGLRRRHAGVATLPIRPFVPSASRSVPRRSRRFVQPRPWSRTTQSSPPSAQSRTCRSCTISTPTTVSTSSKSACARLVRA